MTARRVASFLCFAFAPQASFYRALLNPSAKHRVAGMVLRVPCRKAENPADGPLPETTKKRKLDKFGRPAVLPHGPEDQEQDCIWDELDHDQPGSDSLDIRLEEIMRLDDGDNGDGPPQDIQAELGAGAAQLEAANSDDRGNAPDDRDAPAGSAAAAVNPETEVTEVPEIAMPEEQREREDGHRYGPRPRNAASGGARAGRRLPEDNARGAGSLFNERTVFFGDFIIGYRSDRCCYVAKCPVHTYKADKMFQSVPQPSSAMSGGEPA